MTADVKPPWLSFEDVGTGDSPAVFIDDSGSPGQATASVHLHPHRKTWVAVMMDIRQLSTTYDVLPQAMLGLRQHVGATEFHFAELLSGKGLRSAPDTRLQPFQLMAGIFKIQQYPVIVQTISPDNVEEHKDILSALRKVGPFDLGNPTDLAFLILLWRVGRFIEAHAAEFSRPPLIFADEGRFRAGRAVVLRPLLDFAAHHAVFFRASTEMMFLQLADFAAFSVNRSQWLLAKQNRTAKDNALLQVLAQADFNVVNLPTLGIDLATWHVADYDEFHARDRLSKGLHERPAGAP